MQAGLLFFCLAAQNRTISFEPGFYSLGQIAQRFSTPEKPLRVAKNVANRAAFVALQNRDSEEALGIIEEGLGLEIEVSPKFRTLIESKAVARRERTWRSELFTSLRNDVLEEARLAQKLSNLSLPEMEAEADREARDERGRSSGGGGLDETTDSERRDPVAATRTTSFEEGSSWMRSGNSSSGMQTASCIDSDCASLRERVSRYGRHSSGIG